MAHNGCVCKYLIATVIFFTVLFFLIENDLGLKFFYTFSVDRKKKQNLLRNLFENEIEMSYNAHLP